MTLRQPAPPTGGPLMEGAEIVSLRCGEMDTGMLIVVRDRNNETHTMMLNPVVAHALRGLILQCGKVGNWLDEKGEIIRPSLSHL
jgi:hypothetical protein